MALFVKDEKQGSVNLLEHSACSERSWHLVHTSHGPLLLGLWYRPPNQGEVASVNSLEKEWAELDDSAVGALLVGDLNVHNEAWLKYSTGTTPEGRALQHFCAEHGLEEKVKKPTRGENLLDLVLTSAFQGCFLRRKCLAAVSDFSRGCRLLLCVLAHFSAS